MLGRDLRNEDDVKLIQLCANRASLAYQSENEIQDAIPGAQFFENTETDTQGYIVISDNSVFVVFRGTQEPQDWHTDFDTAQVQFSETADVNVHKGFRNAMMSVYNQTIYAMLLQHRNKPIFFIGHSLGGALATLAMFDWMLSNSRCPRTPCYLYNFGTPQCGTNAFADTFKGMLKDQDRVVRIVNRYDRVTTMPFDISERLNWVDWEHVADPVELPGRTATDWLPWLWSIPAAPFRGFVHDHGIAEYQISIDRQLQAIKEQQERETRQFRS